MCNTRSYGYHENLLSLCVMTLPVCNISSATINMSHSINITKCTLVLMFLSTLMTILLVLTLISWLTVGTFWLSHSQLRLEVEQDVSRTREKKFLTLLDDFTFLSDNQNQHIKN